MRVLAQCILTTVAALVIMMVGFAVQRGHLPQSPVELFRWLGSRL